LPIEGAAQHAPPSALAETWAMWRRPSPTPLPHSMRGPTLVWSRARPCDFLNMCALVDTTLAPHALLDVCLALETEAGRVRFERWGPRVLDIDLLAYGDLSLADERLVVPHPRMFERAFVLAPLAEIAPGLRVASRAVADLARAIDASGLTIDAQASARVRG